MWHLHRREDLKTGNTNFRDRAKQNFDMMCARGWDSVLGGGIYWNTQQAIQMPVPWTGRYRCLPYQIYRRLQLPDQGQQHLQLGKSKLFNTSNGAVYDTY